GSGPAGRWCARGPGRAGRRVTVLERDDAVGGKCAGSEVDGRAYDLGGHLFGGHHRALIALAAEVGCELEPVVPSQVYDLEAGTTVVPPAVGIEKVGAYAAARAEQFPGIDARGLAAAAAPLARPYRAWLAERGLTAVAPSEIPYTAGGYGYVADPELAALYPVRFAEMVGALSGRMDAVWTIRGGFMRLWQRVAGG